MAKKSYLTIIRNNWNLLPYTQLLKLINKDETWLDNELKNNDFLWYKLGGFKPICDEVKYFSLSKEDKLKTNKIRKIIEKYAIKSYAKPMDFTHIQLKEDNNEYLKIAYPYSISCGDLFLLEDDLISDDELSRLKASGINALWLHGLLSDLSFYKFSKLEDTSYLKRRDNLQKLINKCLKYGIRIFLYLNEPRAININNLKDEYKYLVGRISDQEAALCFSFKEVQQYLYDATIDLLNHVDNLGGFITITASENLTYCKHKLGSDCPHCKNIPSYKTAAQINNIIQTAINDSKYAKKPLLIANLWGWAEYTGFTKSDVKKGIKLLDPKVAVLSVSEFGTHKDKNGYYSIEEYSLSHGDPCIETIQNLKYAKKLGHKIMTKIQVNNSWECSSIPYIPVFELLIQNIQKLHKLGVRDYMVSWTLGGYPSVNINLLSKINSDFNYDSWLSSLFLDDSENVKKAVHLFSKGMKYFSFTQNLLYYSPLQIGPVNLLYKNPTNRIATMVTYPYDDVSTWLNSDNLDNVTSSFSTLVKYWKKGIKYLELCNTNNEQIKEIYRYSKVFMLTIESLINQLKYNSSRTSNRKESFKILKKELKTLCEFYRLASADSKIGFEASNQYYFSKITS